MTEPAHVPVVTIDGPSGSGKGTIASRLAERLGFHLLDSGALYRIVAARALSQDMALDDNAALGTLAASLQIRFDAQRVTVDGQDLTERIREEEVGLAASKVAVLRAVRDAILDLQRRMQRPPGLVADGRDMGTVVFPAAPLKIYLDASVEERAQRRYNQLKNKGLSVSLRALFADLTERDERDKGRAVSPLEPAQDAIVIDSTHLSIDEVLEKVQSAVVSRGLATSV